MKQNVLIIFGKRIRELRTAQGISQEELAERAGIHRTYIGMVERGEKNITLKNIEKISIALGLEISDIFGGI